MPPPEALRLLRVSKRDTDSETEQVAAWIEQRRSEGITPRDFGIFVRSEAELPRAESALQMAELSYELLQPSAMRLGSKATLSTMHLAKGLEFRAVIVMACDEDVIPNAERIKAITDDSDLDEVVATERHLLYVACTRARDHLLITSGDTCSEFVEDLLPGPTQLASQARHFAAPTSQLNGIRV